MKGSSASTVALVVAACILGTCFVPVVNAVAHDRISAVVSAVVSADGGVVQSEKHTNMTTVGSSGLTQTSSGATWGIKLPTCPSDLNICCAFFQNWDWTSWSDCFNQVVNVGKAILKKVLEILDWITDARKLTGLLLSGPVGTKLWQLWDWGKKSLHVLSEAVQNILEGLVKVVMAMVRLVLAMPKIPGCWTLTSDSRDFVTWSGALIPTDCGAMSDLKKIQMWTFFSTIGNCFIRLSKVPHDSGIPLPTPFLNRHDLSVCTYHVLPILAQLADGFVQIVKAIIGLFQAVLARFLSLVDILVYDYIKGTVAYTLLSNAQMLISGSSAALNNNPPPSAERVASGDWQPPTPPPTVSSTGWRRRARVDLRRRAPVDVRRRSWRSASRATLHEKDHALQQVVDEDIEVPLAFRAAVQRELEKMEQTSVDVPDSMQTANAMMRSDEFSRAALTQLMGAHESEHPDMWQQMKVHHRMEGETPADAAEHDEDENGDVVDKWAMAVAQDMDVQSHIDSLMGVALAESSGGRYNAFVMSIGASVSCDGTFKWNAVMPWKLPLISSTVSVSVGFSIQAGQTLETDIYYQHFSFGLKLAATMALKTAIDIGWPGMEFGPVDTSDPLKKMCDNEKLTSFSVAPGYGGTGCTTATIVDASGLGEGIGVFGWSMNFAMPLVVKALAGALCALVGGPVNTCINMAPGDLVHFAAGYSDLSAKHKWYFKAGFNVLFTKTDVDKPFFTSRMTLLKIGLALSRSHSIFFGVPCGRWAVRSSSSLVATVRAATKARLQSSCKSKAIEEACSRVDQASASSMARCVQQSLSARLACGAGSELEGLHAEQPVVDTSFGIHFAGRPEKSSSGIRVRVQGAWLSGLSRMEVTESRSASLLESGVRTTLSFQSQGVDSVHLRQVCLQWSSVETANAFRDLTGPELSVKQRTRQMAAALEHKVQEEVSSTKTSSPHEVSLMGDWAAFLRHMDEQGQTSVAGTHLDGVHVSTSDLSVAKDGDVRKCFKIRLGKVAATLETSLQGHKADTTFDASTAKLHSFKVSGDVAQNVEQQVLASAPMAAALTSLFGSMPGAPSSTLSVAKQQLTAAVAKQISIGVVTSLASSLCNSLGSVVCPNCQPESLAAWSSHCDVATHH